MTSYVLIPGLGSGSWTWQPVARLLEQEGHFTLPLTLPGLEFGSANVHSTLQDTVDYIVSRVEELPDEQVTLVAHSGGGIAATGAAVALGPDKVGEVIYYSAVVPEQGRSMADENPNYASIIAEALKAGPTIPIDFGAVAFGMMPGEPVELQRLVHSLMVPTPGRHLVDNATFGTVLDAGIPARYLLGADDKALARPGSEFAGRIGLTPQIVPGHHLTLLTDPAVIADAILR